VVLNCLTHNLIPAERLSLLVLDEAHHAALGDSHPYRGVLQQLQTCGPLPRLKRLGLTASPAPGIARECCARSLLVLRSCARLIRAPSLLVQRGAAATRA
jgi:hypothetical protein